MIKVDVSNVINESEIAKYQLNILNNAERIKLLNDSKDQYLILSIDG